MIKKVVNSIVEKIEGIISKIISKCGEDKFLKYFMIAFLVLSLLPVFAPGMFWGQDINFHLSRIQGITESFKSGAFPSLIYPGYFSGYGYANGIFYPDIFLYIPACLCLFGLSTITAYKIFLFILTCTILFSMYFCIKKITKSNYTATIISVLYLVSSYRITDMWIRSAVGETITFVFFPFVILGLYELIYGNAKNWKYLTIGLVGIVLSHIISVIFCIILVLVFGLLNLKKIIKEKRLKYCILGGGLAIGISAFFTMPLIEALLSDTFKYTTYNSLNPIFERSSNPILALIEIPTGIEPWIPQGVGIVFIYLLFKFFKGKITDDNQRKFKNVCIIFALVLLFTSTSLFPWKTIGNLFSIIQFPWRLYILITVLFLFGFSIVITRIVNIKKEKIHLMFILSIFMCFTYCIGHLYLARFGLMNDYRRHVVVFGEYIPVDVDTKKYEQRGEVITSNNDIITNFDRNGVSLKINYKNNTFDNTYLELPLMYYNGYVARENDNLLKVEKGDNGVVRVYLNNTEGTINVYYGLTNIRKIGIGLSFFSLIIFGILCLKKKETNS